MIYDVSIHGQPHRLKIERCETGYRCELDGDVCDVDATFIEAAFASLVIGGKSYRVRRERHAGLSFIWVGAERFAVEVSDPRSLRGKRLLRATSDGPVSLLAPMPGKVVRILVGENAMVEPGQGVVVVEAMKMQNEVKSPKTGQVRKLAIKEGASVNAGDVLAVVE